MRVAVICFKYPPNYSGYGKQLKSVIDKITQLDRQCTFKILTAYSSSEYFNEKKRVQIYPLGIENIKIPALFFYIFSIKVFIWLLSNRKKYDVIHCVKAGPEAVLANYASKLLRKPLVIKIAQDEMSTRELADLSGIKLYFRKKRQKTLSDASNFIAISDEIEKELQNRISKKTFIRKIPNGVETNNLFTPVTKDRKIEIRKKLKLHEDDVVILYVGAINKRKGIPELLDAIKEIPIEDKFTVIMCGPILENIHFHEKINEINRQRKYKVINYLGSIENVDQYMKSADIFILPSYSEGLPNVLLEAAASGLALVTTDIGGSRDIVMHNYNGKIVAPGNVLGITKALNELICNISLREKFSSNARKVAIEKYSLDIVASEYINLYNQLLNS